jgi:hypothetical protein
LLVVFDPPAERIRSLFQALLPRGTRIVVGPLGEDHMLEVGEERLRVRSVGRGDARTVRFAVAADPKPDVVVGARLSEAARQLARVEGVNWADETGAAEIKSGSMIIALSGRRSTRRPPSGSGWSEATLGTAEAILVGVKPTVRAVHEATGYSESTAVRTLAFLGDRGHLEASKARGRGSGRRVVDRDRLLSEYAEAAHDVRPKSELRCGVLWRDPQGEIEQIGERWSAEKVGWAAAGALAASLQAPYLTQLGAGAVYVEATGDLGLLAVARCGGLEPLDGGRLLLRPFPTRASARLTQEIHGMRVTSWPRTYADLRFEGVRGEEAAEHLRDVCDVT